MDNSAEKGKSQTTPMAENEAPHVSLADAEGSNRYTIKKTLGKGAMGVVYLAHDSVLERDVAVKELHSNLASKSGLMKRFRSEAKVLAKMAHPGIVQIYDLVETNNCVWIVMEFVKGEDLAGYLEKRGVLPPKEVCAIGAQIAEALAYAHSLGIVHRDFKPANVLLANNGMPKIMDFGLAKLAQSSEFHTAAGTILGTPVFMSPEQAAGQQADARSDIYSFGITLYYMSTGKVPFMGELASILAQHINTPPNPPKALNPEIPDSLQNVIMSLLEKDPSKRVQDMATVAGMLKGTIPSAQSPGPVAESPGSGMGSLLEQKEKLEQMIKEQYTRHICVMFTDLKGSTAIADLQGDLAARMVIKKHIDILTPIIRGNKGKLVKTMGDGTMSYYERETDAVRAAVEIHKGINAYNEGMEGQTAINIRVGISSGKAFVEENDIFGDVVNVSSRFESSCSPGEIYISESTYDGLGENKEEYFIRHVKNITFKGKAAPSKVFKVFYRPEEIEREKANPTDPDAQSVKQETKLESTPATESQMIKSQGMTFARAQRPSVTVSHATAGGAKMIDHKQQAKESQKELTGRVIKNGDVVKLTNEKYRVTGDITVATGAVLVLNNAELYFAENAGIIVMGVIRAVNSVFSAIDPEKGWRNCVISAEKEDKPIEIDNCKFYFGRGRTAEELKLASDIVIASPTSNTFFGGGLLISGGTAKTLKIKQTGLYKCIANEGGGIYFYRSQSLLDGCLFEGCMAKNGSGGGIHTFGSDITIVKSAFVKCSSGNSGGGVCATSSKNSMIDSVFRICMSKRGGGVACIASDSQIKDCRFEQCSSVNGGGIFKDNKSSSVIERPSFQNCKPNDIA